VQQLAGGLESGKGRLAQAARHELDQAASSLALARGRAVHGAIVATERTRSNLDRQSQHVVRIARHTLSNADERLSHRRTVLDAYDPRRQLARGWSLTKASDGRILRSVRQVPVGGRILTVLSDGTLESQVDHLLPNDMNDAAGAGEEARS
jgi:exodeoxyribonuclease VII large subunit